MHGKKMALPDDWDCLFILGADIPAVSIGTEDEYPTTIATRKGMYSRAHNSTTDFEWDGWRTS